jgi:D-threo-aldose 1-dehydrogenase
MSSTYLRALGRTGLSVSTLGLGGTAIGNLYRAQTDETTQRVVELAFELGVRYLDTAPAYGNGLSEIRLGQFLATRPRADFVISTKVGRLLVDPSSGEATSRSAFVDVPERVPRFDYTSDGILRSFESSLERLCLQHVDLLLLHDLAPHNHGSQHAYERQYRTLFERGGYDALVALRAEGRVRKIGVGVGDALAAERLLREGDFDVVLLAGRYTLLEQDALKSLLPLCERRGTGVIIGGPFNSGILASGAVEGAKYNYRDAPPAVLEKVDRIERVCSAHGVSMIAAALQFPLRHPAVSSVIPGIATPQELRAAVQALAVHIPPALFSDLKSERLLAENAPT